MIEYLSTKAKLLRKINKFLTFLYIRTALDNEIWIHLKRILVWDHSFWFLNQIIWGGTPKFLEFCVSLKLMFNCIFIRKFLEVFEIWSFMFCYFFEKLLRISPKISEILWTFSKLKTSIIFVLKLIQNHYIDQNSAKIFLQTPKNVIFRWKALFFKILDAFGAKNLEFISNVLELPPSPLG